MHPRHWNDLMLNLFSSHTLLPNLLNIEMLIQDLILTTRYTPDSDNLRLFQFAARTKCPFGFELQYTATRNRRSIQADETPFHTAFVYLRSDTRTGKQYQKCQEQ